MSDLLRDEEPVYSALNQISDKESVASLQSMLSSAQGGSLQQSDIAPLLSMSTDVIASSLLGTSEIVESRSVSVDSIENQMRQAGGATALKLSSLGPSSLQSTQQLLSEIGKSSSDPEAGDELSKKLDAVLPSNPQIYTAADVADFLLLTESIQRRADGDIPKGGNVQGAVAQVAVQCTQERLTRVAAAIGNQFATTDLIRNFYIGTLFSKRALNIENEYDDAESVTRFTDPVLVSFFDPPSHNTQSRVKQERNAGMTAMDVMQDTEFLIMFGVIIAVAFIASRRIPKKV